MANVVANSNANGDFGAVGSPHAVDSPDAAGSPREVDSSREVDSPDAAGSSRAVGSPREVDGPDAMDSPRAVDSSRAVDRRDVADGLGSAVGQWAELVSTALVGTDRRAVPGTGPRSAHGESAHSGFAQSGSARNDSAHGDPAIELLSRAAVAGLVRRVGMPPERFDGTLPEPAPADPRRLLPEPAVRRLRTILDSYPKYLPEWLAAVRAAGLRLPAAFFPPLLDLGRTNTLIRADLALVLGPPGRWLATASGNWRFLLREARERLYPEDWQSPDPDARISYVAGLFARDAEAARRLIREAWGSERVPVKLALLGLLGRYPDPADLPFVEGLSKDPSKQVRDEATLLAGVLLRRRDKPAPPAFAAEVARLLAHDRGIGRDLHTFVMSRADEPWPEDGTLLLLEALAAYGARTDQAAWSSWIAEQLQTAVADHAPVVVRDRVAALVAGQAVAAIDGAAPRIDFASVLALLDFRRDMLAELRISES